MRKLSITKSLGLGVIAALLTVTAWLVLARDAPTRSSVFSEALSATMGIEQADGRAMMLSFIAAAQGSQALFEEAIATANGIEDAEIRSHTLKFVSMAQAGQLNTYYGELFNRRNTGLSEMAVEQAKNGQFTMALEEARRNDSLLTRELALNDIAVAQAVAGLFDEALKTVNEIGNQNIQSTALRRVAAAQAQAGMFDEALVTARGIEVADRRIAALIDVASAMTEK